MLVCEETVYDGCNPGVALKSLFVDHALVKDEGHYRIDGKFLKNELQKWNQHPRKPRVPVISSF